MIPGKSFWHKVLAGTALYLTAAYPSVDLAVEGQEFYSARKIKNWVAIPQSFAGIPKRDIKNWKEDVSLDVEYEYEKSGFFEVRVDVEIISVDSEDDKWTVRLQVREGPRYTFGNVEIVTQDSSAPLILLEQLRSRSGIPFHTDRINKDKRDIEKVYGDAGYAKRKVRLNLELLDSLKAVEVSYLIDPSYLVVFDSLIIRNGKERREEFAEGISDQRFVRGLLGLSRGDTVNLSQTNNFKAKLKTTRVFNSVRLKDSLIEDSEHRSVLILNTAERVPGSLYGSLFWETQDGFGVEGGWGHKNIFGRFYEGKMLLRLAQRRQNVSLGMANPLLFGIRLRFENDMDLIWRQQIRLEESPFDALFSSSLNWPFLDHLRLLSKIEFESTEDSDEKRIVNLNYINSLLMIFLDNEFNPRRGTRMTFTWGNGGELIDQAGNFQLIQLRHNWGEVNSAYYYPLTRWMVGAMRLDGGFFTSSGGTNSRRFFLGGRTNVRNKDFRELCPEKALNADGVLICVTEDATPVYFLTSLEARLNLFTGLGGHPNKYIQRIKDLQFVPFTDLGRVWESGESLRPEGDGFDVGLGARFPIMVFNFRLDYAVGWDGRPDWSDYKIIIDLAQAF